MPISPNAGCLFQLVCGMGCATWRRILSAKPIIPEIVLLAGSSGIFSPSFTPGQEPAASGHAEVENRTHGNLKG